MLKLFHWSMFSLFVQSVCYLSVWLRNNVVCMLFLLQFRDHVVL